MFYSPAGVEYVLRRPASTSGRPRLSTRLVGALMIRLERRVLNRCGRIVVLSEFSRRVLEEIHGLAGRAITTIPAGVDLEHFHPAADRGAVREELGIPHDRNVLLTVRDLEPRMGIEAFLEALARMSPERTLGIVGGTGPLSVTLAHEARRLGVDRLVRFVGHIPEDELPLYYQAADLFVLPTRAHEGFGLVTVEALACGTPVVATPVGATPEILGPLDPRLLSEDPSADALLNALERGLRLVSDPGLRRRCRIYAERRYNWDRHIDRLETELVAVSTGPVRD
jgi:glycosyltransferase involved in cell wall biosynthesis